MIGTHPAGKGGVASVISVYIAEGLFKTFPVRYVASHVEHGRWQKVYLAVKAGLILAADLLRGRVALVHVHSASNASFMRKSSYLALARWFGVPTIFHLHGGGFAKYVESHSGDWVARRVKRTLGASSAVVALSESWARYLRSLSVNAKVVTIANPVPMQWQKSDTPADPTRLLFLGRASRAKGVFDLIDAVAALRANGRELRLAIGGDGDLDALRAHIERREVQDCVEVLGWIGPERKQSEFDRASIFVLPSYDEGLPMAMLEAMAQAKAVVVTPVGGIPEAVQDGEHALLVNAGDVVGLTRAMERLLSDAELRRLLGEKARQRVAQRFAAQYVLEQIGALYKELGVTLKAAHEQR